MNECLYKYNYEIEHTSTGFKPIYLKDTNDINLINAVLGNINKKYKQFHKEDKKVSYDEEYYLLFEKV